MSLLRKLFIRGASGNEAEVTENKELLVKQLDVSTQLNQYLQQDTLNEILIELQEINKTLKKIYQ